MRNWRDKLSKWSLTTVIDDDNHDDNDVDIDDDDDDGDGDGDIVARSCCHYRISILGGTNFMNVINEVKT